MSTRRTGLKTFVKGQVLCREGDPPGSIYVICSGSVRAYRRDPTSPASVQELARLGQGDIVGEMAAILGQPRSATVQALEQTKVLEIAADNLGALGLRHESLLRVIAHALKERTGLSDREIAATASRMGVYLPRELLSGEPDSPSLPVPPYDPTIVYPKSLTCPACGATFATLVIHARKDQPVERSSDFHQRYATPYNPYDFELWVCPNDLYAALPADFGELSDAQRSNVRRVVTDALNGEQPDFNGERSLALREKGLLLALALYHMREAGPARLAAIHHRLAWCARERGDSSAEQTWLAQAADAYARAYSESDLDDAKDELRLLYLCGELNARMGDASAAFRWFGQALRHPALKDHSNWERLIRERWSEVRAEVGAASADAEVG